jgi:hypothetical protein
MHRASGQTAAAVEIALDIATVRAHILGDDHPDTVVAANNALHLWLKLDDHQAHTHAEALLALRTRVGSERDLARVRSRLDRIRQHTAAATPAPPPAPQAAPVPPARQRPARREPAEAAPAMAEIRTAVNAQDYPAAVTATEALIITMTRVYGPEHEHTLAAVDVRAQMLAAAGETTEALAVYIDLAQRLARHDPRDDDAIDDAARAADRLWHRLGTNAAGLRAAHAVLAMHESAHPDGLAAAQAHRDTIRDTLANRRRATG